MSSPPAQVAAPPASERLRLARLALAAALTDPDVVRAEAGLGGLFVTMDGLLPLRGVSVAAAPGGRYDAQLRLVARPVPLHALAARVRGRVGAMAEREGVADRLDAIDIDFADLELPGEAAPAAHAEPSAPVLAPGAT